MNQTLTAVTFVLCSFLLSPASATERDVGHEESLQPGEITGGPAGIRGRVAGMKSGSPLLQITPGAKIRLAAPDAKGIVRIELESGMVRVQVPPRSDHRPVLEIKTRMAVMGVRGTDFVAIATPVLGEAEIVVLEGTVDFASASDPSDRKSVDKGHWGGIGGRFGAKTHELIALSKEQLEYFNRTSEIR